MQKVSYVHRGTEASRSSDCDELQVPFASVPQREGEHAVRSFERAIEALAVDRFEQDLGVAVAAQPTPENVRSSARSTSLSILPLYEIT